MCNSERSEVATRVLLGFVRLLRELLKLRSCSPQWVKLHFILWLQGRQTLRVSYLHEEPQQLQVSSCAELELPVELFFATSKIIAFSWPQAAGSFGFQVINDNISCGLSTN